MRIMPEKYTVSLSMEAEVYYIKEAQRLGIPVEDLLSVILEIDYKRTQEAKSSPSAGVCNDNLPRFLLGKLRKPFSF